MCKIKSAIIMVLFYAILFIPHKVILANCVKYDQKDVVVGLLSTKFVSYPDEYKTAMEITKLLQSYGVHVILMDYNVIMQLAKDEIIRMNKINQKSYEISRYDIIENVVAKFIEEHDINRILIPGNYYNISSFPLAPSLDRQLITDAIVKIVYNKCRCIHLLGICGGLQGIMHASGIKITRIENIINSHISVKSHVISMPNPKDVDANLHQVMVISGSRLSDIINKLNHELLNKQIMYFPDAHSEAIDNNIDNIIQMYDLGYKVVALSEDGIIEAIEDKYGNIHFQFHPEYLMINAEEKYSSNTTYRDISIMIADAIIRDFLFRN